MTEPPLFLSIDRGLTKVAAFLLHKRVDVNRRDVEAGRTALFRAGTAYCPHRDMQEIEKMREGLVVLLLKFRAEADATDRAGETPLIFCCRSGCATVPMAKHLIEARADPR